MPAILGLRGTGDFTADERPKNWREMLLYLFPNGEAPLTALSSMGKSQGTDSVEYSWWEKRLPTQRMRVNGTHTAAATTITVVSGAKDSVKGTVVLVESTNELLLVNTDPSSDTSITVTRSYGAVNAATIPDADYLVVITNVHDDGSSVPTAKSYAPTKKFNYTEIYRMPLYLTRSSRRERLRWDNTGPYREAKREALSLYSIEMEKSYLFGEPVETTGFNGKQQRMTGGIVNFITTNKGSGAGGSTGASSKFAVNGPLDEDTLDDLLEDTFRYGATEKLCLCGSTFVRAITTLGKRNGTLQMVPRDTTYGMKIVEYTSAFGTLMLKMHPLFNQHPVWRKNALIIDANNFVERVMDETRFIKNRQSPGEDASLDEFLGESGTEIHYEETHAYIEGVTTALVA